LTIIEPISSFIFRNAYTLCCGAQQHDLRLCRDRVKGLGFVREGRPRPIFVPSPNRNSALPVVPTADETGLPGFHVAA
jgi:hypothetical protein